MNIEDVKGRLGDIDDNLNILSELISDTPIQRYFLNDAKGEPFKSAQAYYFMLEDYISKVIENIYRLREQIEKQ